MKKLLFITLGAFFNIMIQAQVSKTINVTTAGTLFTLLTDSEKTNVTNLTITGTIDSLDFWTMHKMKKLSILDLSNSTIAAYNNMNANSIPNWAFGNGFSTLTLITLPPSIDTIGSYAFMGSVNLKTLTIPPSVTYLGEQAFSGCKGLSSIILSSSLSNIGNGVFANCISLVSINIPSSVTSIEDEAFSNCTNLTSLSIPPSVKTIGNQAFSECIGLTSIVIPTSVTSIGSNAFRKDSNLTTITIPSTVISIGGSAFSECIELQSIYAYSTFPVNLSDDVFDRVNKSTCILYVPFGSKILYQSANQWKDFINIIEMSSLCSTTVNDTSNFYVSSIEFKKSSPRIYLDSTANLKTMNGRCDSIVNYYSKYIYNSTNCSITDTIHVKINDTITISKTVIDTIHVTQTTHIAVTDTLIINAVLTGIVLPNNINTIKIYPNPTKDHITINYGEYTTMSGYTLKITNTLGITVYTSLVNQQSTVIDLNSFGGKGIYYVQLIDGNGKTTDIRQIVLQ